MSASIESFITSTRIVCSSFTGCIASSAASADLRIISTLRRLRPAPDWLRSARPPHRKGPASCD